VARHPGIVISALSWNLFHGRDWPPDPALRTWRSRLFCVTEANETHVQVNRPLLDEFVAVLEREDWHVALLQEAPPRWYPPLRERLGAVGALVPTSRNSCAPVRAWLAERNPDLIASNEGGSNQILARPPWRIAATRTLTLTRRPERRRMLWARLERPGASVAVANLHATAGEPAAAAREVELAAELAVEWSEGTPLIFGGDLNLRPAPDGRVFDELRARHGLAPPTAPGSIDHLLVRGLDVADPPRRLPPGRREAPGERGLRIRLSDHAPVAARFIVR
jgi:endonuclease/exonuclease/phosphatase family metal-dependent hydrolase